MTLIDSPNRPASTSRYDAALFIARLGLASLFLFSGLQKMMHLQDAGAWAASQGVHFASQLMPLAALFEIAAALMLVSGWRALWIIVLGPWFHRFWNAPPQMWQVVIDDFFHHLVMFGGMIYVAVFGPGSWRLRGPRKGEGG